MAEHFDNWGADPNLIWLYRDPCLSCRVPQGEWIGGLEGASCEKRETCVAREEWADAEPIEG